MQFLPEFVLIASALVFFLLSLGKLPVNTLRRLALSAAFLSALAALASMGQSGVYFFDAYSIEPFSRPSRSSSVRDCSWSLPWRRGFWGSKSG